jgi:hypothetical protein
MDLLAATNTKTKGKLTRTVSTKLSMEDYKVFRVLTNLAHKHNDIKEDSQSEMLRLLIDLTLNELRKHPEFSLLQ